MQASAASWLAETGLPVDKDGFLLINDYLQSDGGPPNVFAAGDVASNSRNPRPKAGVFAVRAVSDWWQRGGGLEDKLQGICADTLLGRGVCTTWLALADSKGHARSYRRALHWRRTCSAC